MKKRILAMILALLMLVGAPIAYAGSAWQQASQHYNGGLLQYGSLELRCEDAYAVLDFAYGSNVSLGETTMQDIAAQLSGNQFPVVSPLSSREQAGSQSFFLITSLDQTAVEQLVVNLEKLADEQEAKKAAAPAVDEPAGKDVSSGDVSPTDAVSAEDISDDELNKLFELFGKLSFNSEETAVSGADAASGSDVSAADVSAGDVSAADAPSDTDAPDVKAEVSAADAASGSDVSTSDVSASDAAANLTAQDKLDLMTLLGMLGNFGKNTSDSDADAAVSGADVSASDVSASDVSSADAAAADGDKAVSAADAAAEESDADKEAAQTPDEEAETPDEDTGAADVEGEAAVSGSDAAEYIDYRPVIANLLDMRTAGMFSAPAKPTLEQTLESIFPGFYFADSEKLVFSPVASENVTLSGDCLTAQVLIRPESEYVDVELNGKIFSVLLMNQKSTSYTVNHVYVNGSTDKLPQQPVVTTTTTTEATTTVTETTTTTTETTTAATTAPTTAAATTEATTTTTTETTTTTTTTAPTTTTTTAATEKIPSDKLLTGYVSTRRLVLRVRTGPGLGYEVIKTIPKGTVVTILGMPNDDWYQVRLDDGTEGYCYSYYITIHQHQ